MIFLLPGDLGNLSTVISGRMPNIPVLPGAYQGALPSVCWLHPATTRLVGVSSRILRRNSAEVFSHLVVLVVCYWRSLLIMCEFSC